MNQIPQLNPETWNPTVGKVENSLKYIGIGNNFLNSREDTKINN